MPAQNLPPVLAAIDVGTNAVRLEMARVDSQGSLEPLLQERAPVRPGEGVFATGTMPEATAQRLLSTLRRFAALCRRHRAQVRAVATSALREAKNRDRIVERVREETGLHLEVVSGKEEARLICLGVLHGKNPRQRSLLVDIGGGSTEVATATGEKPEALWSVALGAVRLTELFGSHQKLSSSELHLMKGHVAELLRKTLPERAPTAPEVALGSSGTIQAILSFAASPGQGEATLDQLTEAVEDLARMRPERRRRHFDPQRADIVLAGAVILEGVAQHLRLASVRGVQRGLRDGVLVDLLHRQDLRWEDSSLYEAAVDLGRRFHFDEQHARQVARLALALFDQLTAVHQLPLSARPYLEVASLLHDVGTAVSQERHHRHTYYLIHHGDLPGLSDREREWVARVARFHRRSPPDLTHSGMLGLTPTEARLVRKLATLLRLANALDHSHQEAVQALKVRIGREDVALHLKPNHPLDLELWNADHQAALFRRVFGKRLTFQVSARARKTHVGRTR